MARSEDTTVTTNLETHRLSLSLRAFVAVIVFVVGAVSSVFIASDKINKSIEQTNERIEQTNVLLQSQQNLIMSNRFRDSIERSVLQAQIDFILNNHKK